MNHPNPVLEENKAGKLNAYVYHEEKEVFAS
jgi:hypothetical protein